MATVPFHFSSGPWTQEAWDEQLGRATEEVRLWFEEATNQYAVPTAAGCRLFAECIFNFSRFDDDAKPSSRELINKHSRVLLKHLNSERKIAENVLRLIRFERAQGAEKHEDFLQDLDDIRKCLERVIDYLQLKDADRTEPIRFLGELAQELWAETNGGARPTSPRPDGPICKVLERALITMRRSLRRASISEVLRGRRRAVGGGQTR